MKYAYDVKGRLAMAEEYRKKLSEAEDSAGKSIVKRKN